MQKIAASSDGREYAHQHELLLHRNTIGVRIARIGSFRILFRGRHYLHGMAFRRIARRSSEGEVIAFAAIFFWSQRWLAGFNSLLHRGIKGLTGFFCSSDQGGMVP
jgi:hypothetical protein